MDTLLLRKIQSRTDHINPRDLVVAGKPGFQLVEECAGRTPHVQHAATLTKFAKHFQLPHKTHRGAISREFVRRKIIRHSELVVVGTRRQTFLHRAGKDHRAMVATNQAKRLLAQKFLVRGTFADRTGTLNQPQSHAGRLSNAPPSAHLFNLACQRKGATGIF